MQYVGANIHSQKAFLMFMTPHHSNDSGVALWLLIGCLFQITSDKIWCALESIIGVLLEPQRPLRRCWGSPWGGGSVLVLSSRASVAPKQPQGRVRPPEIPAWFYTSVHYYWRRRVFCQLWMGQKTAPMWSDDQVWSFDQVMYTGVLVHIAQATIILSQYQVAAANVVLQWSSLAGLLFGELSEEQV